jgi:hypothetical protein
VAEVGGGTESRMNLSTYNNTKNCIHFSLIATDTGNFRATFNINLNTSEANANSQFTSLFTKTKGYIKIGSQNPNIIIEVGDAHDDKIQSVYVIIH